MSVDTAAADRLPWLADEPAPRRAKPRRRGSLLPWAAAVAAMVGVGGFWMGVRSVEHPAAPPSRRAQPTMTVQLPPPQPPASPEVVIPAQAEVRPTPVPEVRPAPSREVRIAAPPHPKATAQETAKVAPVEATASAEAQQSQPAAISSTPAKVAAAPPAPAAVPFVMPRPWDPRVFAGAAGRVVQIGAFGSVTQAKRGWWFMVRDYPAMAHLPAVVRPTRNSKGRFFYRFQVGTTSQAHSEVLCQRMQKIQFSCAVVGLPWKAKVER